MARKKWTKPRKGSPGWHLQQARGDRTQAEMAKAIGVSQVTIAQYEFNLKVPRASRLTQIASAYGVDVAHLIPRARAA